MRVENSELWIWVCGIGVEVFGVNGSRLRVWG